MALEPKFGQGACPDQAEATTRVVLLGPMASIVPAKGAAQRLAEVDAALLARLALDGPVPRRNLADWLWPHTTAAGAATSLRQRLYRLKNNTGHPVAEGEVNLRLSDNVVVDLHRFEETLKADPLYGFGDLLEGQAFADNDAVAQWLQARRQWLAAVKLKVLLAHVDRLSRQRDTAGAEAVANRLVQELPLNETAWRCLITLHHQQGNRAQALAAYERCRSTLHQAMQVHPSPETQALARLVTSSAPPSDALHKGSLAPRSALPAALLRPPVLVQRQTQLQQAADALGHGRPVLLVGAAGVGKSRLLGELSQALGPACVADAGAGDGAMPYAYLALLLDQASQRWGWPMAGELRADLQGLLGLSSRTLAAPEASANDAGSPAHPLHAARLQRACGAALLAWHNAGLALVALDDLHHADEASMELLAPLVAQTARQGLRWLLAARPEVCPGTHAVLGLESLLQLNVPALDEEGICELLKSLPVPPLQQADWATVLLQRTGGNPLYVLQLITTLVESGVDLAVPSKTPLPASLLQLVARRLDRLSSTARSLVRLAAVAGTDFSLRLAAGVMQQSPLALSEPWIELETAGMMKDETFAHDLIAEAAAQATPSAIARLLHEQVAKALHDHHGAPARVAHHWEAASCWSEAALAYETAARQAAALNATYDEMQKWQAAARCHRAAGAAGKAFDADCAAAHLAIYQSILTDELQALCTNLADMAQDAKQQAAAKDLLAHFHIERYAPQEGLPLGLEAMEQAERAGNTELQLRAARRCGLALMRLRRADEALALLEPLLPLTTTLPLPERLDWLADLTTVMSGANQRRRALQMSAQIALQAESAGLWQVAAVAWGAQGVTLAHLGRLGESCHASTQAVNLSRRAGTTESGLLVDRSSLGGSLRDLGRFDEYLASAESLIEELHRNGNPFWAHNAEHDLAVAWAWLGRPERVHRLLRLDVAELHPVMRVLRLRHQAHLAADFGLVFGTDTASTLAQRAQLALEEAGVPKDDMLRLSVALAAARSGPPEQGIGLAESAAHKALEQENVMLATGARVVALHLQLAAGNLHASMATAHDLMDQITSSGPPVSLYTPLVWWLCHQALAAHEPAAAAHALQQAAQWIKDRSEHHVPAVLVDSFLHRNPINRAVLLAVGLESPTRADLRAGDEPK